MQTLMKQKITIADCVSFFTIFAYIVFGNALTFNLGQRFPVKLQELISIIAIIYLLKKVDLSFGTRSVFSGIVGWVIWGWISSIIVSPIYSYTISEMIYGWLYGGRILHLLLLTSLLSRYLIKKKRYSVKELSNFISNCFVVVELIGIIQLLLFPIAYDWYDLFYGIGVYFPNPDPHVNRLISTYFDPNFLSSILVIPFTIELYKVIFEEKKSLFSIIKLLLTVIVVFLTSSRSGLLGCVIASGLMLLMYIHRNRFRRWIFIFFAVILVAIPIILSSNIRVIDRILNFMTDPSAQARFKSWRESFEIILKNLLFGIGYNMLGAYRMAQDGQLSSSTGYGVDSSILMIVITTGIVGLIAFVLFIMKIIKQKDPANSSIASLNKVIIISSLTICFFNNLLFYVLWLFPFLLMIKFCEDEKSLAKEAKNGNVIFTSNVICKEQRHCKIECKFVKKI